MFLKTLLKDIFCLCHFNSFKMTSFVVRSLRLLFRTIIVDPTSIMSKIAGCMMKLRINSPWLMTILASVVRLFCSIHACDFRSWPLMFFFFLMSKDIYLYIYICVNAHMVKIIFVDRRTCGHNDKTKHRVLPRVKSKTVKRLICYCEKVYCQAA